MRDPDALRTPSDPLAAAGPLTALGLAFFLVITVRTAWISDVAYYSLRTAEHAASGLGLRWNAAERVAAYDHPLWLALIATGRLFFSDVYWITIAASLGCSALACVLLLRHAATNDSILLAGAMVCLSPLFVSFSTSGLESPLLHLVLIGLARVALSARKTSSLGLSSLALLTSAAALTQPLTLLIVIPSIVALAWGTGWRRVTGVFALAFVPSVFWSVWSFWYYGAVVPNTWLAWKGLNGSWSELIAAGGVYLEVTAREDPLLLAIVAGGLVAGFSRPGPGRALATGMAAFSFWVVVRGGSYMAGYPLTAAAAVGMVLIVDASREFSRPITLAAVAAAIGLSMLAPDRTFSTNAGYGARAAPTHRPHNARLEDYPATGLLLFTRYQPTPRHPEANRARNLEKVGAQTARAGEKPGFFGFAAGPDVFAIDPTGRGDALVARLPRVVGRAWYWSAVRRIPDGYDRAALGNPEDLRDGSLATAYRDLRSVTRDALFESRRLGRMLGLDRSFERGLDQSSYGPQHMAASALTGERRTIGEGGILIDLRDATPISEVMIELTNSYAYSIAALDRDKNTAHVTSPAIGSQDQGLAARRVLFDRRIVASAIAVRCVEGTGPCLLGRFDLAH